MPRSTMPASRATKDSGGNSSALIPSAQAHNDVFGLGLSMLAAVAFGTLAISAKIAYEAGATPLPLLAARFAITAALLAAYHWIRRISLRLPNRRDRVLVALLGLGYAVESALFFLALERAPAAIVSLVFYSFPLWTTVLSVVAGLERFHLRTVVALALGTGGVVLIFSIPRTDPEGPLIALAAAIAVALFLIATQISLRTVVPSVAATGTAAGAAVALAAASVVAGEPFPAAAVLPALGLGIATAIAFIAFYGAIARIGSTRTAIAAMLEPVTTIALAAIILNEALTSRVVVGAVLVVAAIPVLATRKRELPAADAL